MLGDFLKQNNHERISPEMFCNIGVGTPIVSYNEQWEYFMQFGIFVSLNEVYYQYFDSIDFVTIRRCNMSHFSNDGKNTIYKYIPKFSYNPEFCVYTARKMAQCEHYKGLYSILGDDFVLSCLIGPNQFAQMFNGSKMGHHYVENRRKLLKYSHHAIAIEEGYVIHFAHNENDGIQSIHITLQDFYSLNSPKVVFYKDENLRDRLSARNRALLAITGYIDFGKYNLATNNCEHFATWCKTGKAKSIQVFKAIESMTLIAGMLMAKRPYPIATKVLQRYLL